MVLVGRGDQRAGVVEDQHVDVSDNARLRGEWKEIARLEQPEIGVMPTDQRLGPEQLRLGS